MNRSFSNQSDYDNNACSVGKAGMVPPPLEFINYLTNPMGTVSGIAIDGVQLFTPVNALSSDPFYPKSWANGQYDIEAVDSCLGHP